MNQHETITAYIKSLYSKQNPVLLHCPEFMGNEKKYLIECIDTKYVSYIGHFVSDMEDKIKEITGSKFAVAMVNGTSALHLLLLSAGIQSGDEVITQSFSFVATAAAIVYINAAPIFVDVDMETLGMSPDSLENFLSENTAVQNGACINKKTGRRIKAVVPMHTFGHPVKIEKIKKICDAYGLMLVEDAAESLGSYYQGKHTGTFGKAGILSFNGNKLATTGGGGMVITDDEAIAGRVRYLSTTAKRPHRWEFYHDEVGYNLRMPSLNAAVGLAQLEYFDTVIENKRETARLYQQFFKSIDMTCISEPENARSNYWLNAILFHDRTERDEFLEYSNDNGVQTRPAWTLLHTLPPYRQYQYTRMSNAEYIADRLVNIPSSIRNPDNHPASV
jgi:aminotransferase in exopolysaccharide biosynthesis